MRFTYPQVEIGAWEVPLSSSLSCSQRYSFPQIGEMFMGVCGETIDIERLGMCVRIFLENLV
jgi:hypothetical protein